MRYNRRGFLWFMLAAPAALVAAAGLWKTTPKPKLVTYYRTFKIDKRMYPGALGGGKAEAFHEQTRRILQEYHGRRMIEMDQAFGLNR